MRTSGLVVYFNAWKIDNREHTNAGKFHLLLMFIYKKKFSKKISVKNRYELNLSRLKNNNKF